MTVEDRCSSCTGRATEPGICQSSLPCPLGLRKCQRWMLGTEEMRYSQPFLLIGTFHTDRLPGV